MKVAAAALGAWIMLAAPSPGIAQPVPDSDTTAAWTGKALSGVSGSAFLDNATAARARLATASIPLADTTIRRNAIGLVAESGAARASFGNNRLFGNGTDGAFTSTLPLQ